MKLFKAWSYARKTAAGLTATALLGIGTMVVAAHVAGATGASGGGATFSPTTGGSQTSFSVALPASPNNRCVDAQGNAKTSAADGVFVYSYVTPIANNPGDLTFGSTGPANPAGSFARPLVQTSGQTYVAHNTDETGAAFDLAGTQFDFKKFATVAMSGKAVLAPGDYNAGIACYGPNTGNLRFWNNVITVASDPSDPNQLFWGPQGSSPPTTTTTVPPTTTTTIGTPPPPKCVPPNGLISGPLYGLSPSLLGSLATSLCNAGL